MINLLPLSEILSFDHLFDELFHHVNNQSQSKFTEEPNPLIGFSMSFYNYEEFGQNNPNYDPSLDNTLRFTGLMWLRFKNRSRSDPENYFQETGIQIYEGGYSTYGGPWNAFGLRTLHLEENVPWEVRKHLEAYTYRYDFDVSDYARIDQHRILQKLGDGTSLNSFNKEWEAPGQIDEDARYIRFLTDYAK